MINDSKKILKKLQNRSNQKKSCYRILSYRSVNHQSLTQAGFFTSKIISNHDFKKVSLQKAPKFVYFYIKNIPNKIKPLQSF